MKYAIIEEILDFVVYLQFLELPRQPTKVQIILFVGDVAYNHDVDSVVVRMVKRNKENKLWL